MSAVEDLAYRLADYLGKHGAAAGDIDGEALESVNALKRDLDGWDLPGGVLYKLATRVNDLESAEQGGSEPWELAGRIDEIEEELERRSSVVQDLQRRMDETIGEDSFTVRLPGHSHSLPELDKRVGELERELDDLRFSLRWR